MPFTIPDSLDLDQELTTSFGIYHADAESVHVKLQFSRRVARYVAEYRWHPSQQTTPQYDGSLTVEFQISGTKELKSWLLGFGQHAEVLEPPELPDDIINEIGVMAELYTKSTCLNRGLQKKPSPK